MSATTRVFAVLTSILLMTAFAGARADPSIEADLSAPRVAGEFEVTCTPDEKSKKAGAKAFDDTVTLDSDRVRSTALKSQGYAAEALAIPKIVNGVVTVSVSFKRPGGAGKAMYFLRVKKDGTVSGSLTTGEGKDRLRYVVHAKGTPPPNEKKPKAKSAGKGKSKGGGGDAPPEDPAVVRVDGGFVRLMTAQVALAEAGVKDKAAKAKVVQILEAAGGDQITLKGTYLSGTMTAAQYAEAAGRRLDDANRELATVLGADLAKVEAAYEKPMTAEFLYHNAIRAALQDLEATPKVEAANKAVYKRLIDLALLIRKPEGREPPALEKFRSETAAQIGKSLPAAQWAKIQKTAVALTAYRPGQSPAPAAPPPPIELD
jgi:hypothetical protein